MIPGSRSIVLKSQFVKLSTQQSKSSNSEQQEKVPNERSGAGTPSTNPFEQYNVRNSMSGQEAHATSNGQQPQRQTLNSHAPYSNGISSWGSIAEQSTLKQQAVVGPLTGSAQQ